MMRTYEDYLRWLLGQSGVTFKPASRATYENLVGYLRGRGEDREGGGGSTAPPSLPPER